MQEIRQFRHSDAGQTDAPLATRAGDLVFLSGMAYLAGHGVPESVKPLPGYPHHWSRINRELGFIFTEFERVLAEAGSSLGNALKINSYHRHAEDVFEALRLRADFFGPDKPPPSTLVLVPGLPVRDSRVAIDLVTLADDATLPREALTTSTPGAPMPPHEKIWGHRIYSKAVRGGGLIFTSGRTNNVIGAPTDSRSTANVDAPYDLDRGVVATELVLDYLQEVLASFGARLEHVVKADIHLNDPRLIASIDEVWMRYFGFEGPARTFVSVDFPTDNSIIEIELFAVDPEGPLRKRIIAAPEAPAHLAGEPHAVKAGPYLFLSGVLASDYESGVAPEARINPALPYHDSAPKRQAAYILRQVEAICAAASMGPEHLVRRHSVYRDLGDMAATEAVWRQRLPDGIPTTSFQAAHDLPVPGCLMQYDLVGFDPEYR